MFPECFSEILITVCCVGRHVHCRLRLCGGHRLVAMDRGGTSDPYIKIFQVKTVFLFLPDLRSEIFSGQQATSQVPQCEEEPEPSVG